MARQPIEIDRDKLLAAVRKLGKEYVSFMLEDAIDLLPPSNLHKIASKYLDVKHLRPDREKETKSNMLAEVKAFEKASLAGEYYESFNVDSKNFMNKSNGTIAWIADCNRLLARCVGHAREGDAAEVCQAFDIIFGLLDRIGDGNEDIIFFADEGGAWQVGVDWDGVLPPWFKVLSAASTPEEYAERITALLERHYAYGRDTMLSVARKIATPEQQKALAGVTARQRGQWRRGPAQ